MIFIAHSKTATRLLPLLLKQDIDYFWFFSEINSNSWFFVYWVISVTWDLFSDFLRSKTSVSSQSVHWLQKKVSEVSDLESHLRSLDRKKTILGEFYWANTCHFVDHVTWKNSLKIEFLDPKMTTLVIPTLKQINLTFYNTKTNLYIAAAPSWLTKNRQNLDFCNFGGGVSK